MNHDTHSLPFLLLFIDPKQAVMKRQHLELIDNITAKYDLINSANRKQYEGVLDQVKSRANRTLKEYKRRIIDLKAAQGQKEEEYNKLLAKVQQLEGGAQGQSAAEQAGPEELKREREQRAELEQKLATQQTAFDTYQAEMEAKLSQTDLGATAEKNEALVKMEEELEQAKIAAQKAEADASAAAELAYAAGANEEQERAQAEYEREKAEYESQMAEYEQRSLEHAQEKSDWAQARAAAVSAQKQARGQEQELQALLERRYEAESASAAAREAAERAIEVAKLKKTPHPPEGQPPSQAEVEYEQLAKASRAHPMVPLMTKFQREEITQADKASIERLLQLFENRTPLAKQIKGAIKQHELKTAERTKLRDEHAGLGPEIEDMRANGADAEAIAAKENRKTELSGVLAQMKADLVVGVNAHKTLVQQYKGEEAERAKLLKTLGLGSVLADERGKPKLSSEHKSDLQAIVQLCPEWLEEQRQLSSAKAAAIEAKASAQQAPELTVEQQEEAAAAEAVAAAAKAKQDELQSELVRLQSEVQTAEKKLASLNAKAVQAKRTVPHPPKEPQPPTLKHPRPPTGIHPEAMKRLAEAEELKKKSEAAKQRMSELKEKVTKARVTPPPPSGRSSVEPSAEPSAELARITEHHRQQIVVKDAEIADLRAQLAATKGGDGRRQPSVSGEAAAAAAYTTSPPPLGRHLSSTKRHMLPRQKSSDGSRRSSVSGSPGGRRKSVSRAPPFGAGGAMATAAAEADADINREEYEKMQAELASLQAEGINLEGDLDTRRAEVAQLRRAAANSGETPLLSNVDIRALKSQYEAIRIEQQDNQAALQSLQARKLVLSTNIEQQTALLQEKQALLSQLDQDAKAQASGLEQKLRADHAAAIKKSKSSHEVAMTQLQESLSVYQEQLTSVTASAEQLDRQLKEQTDQKAQAEAAYCKLDAEHKSLQAEASTFTSQIDALRAAQSEKDSTLAIKQQQVAELQNSIQQAHDNLAGMLERLRGETQRRKEFQFKYEEVKGKVRVYARVRPFNKIEKKNGEASTPCVRPGASAWNLQLNRTEKDMNNVVHDKWVDFTFDSVFQVGGRARMYTHTHTRLLRHAEARARAYNRSPSLTHAHKGWSQRFAA